MVGSGAQFRSGSATTYVWLPEKVKSGKRAALLSKKYLPRLYFLFTKLTHFLQDIFLLLEISVAPIPAFAFAFAKLPECTARRYGNVYSNALCMSFPG